MEEEEKPDTIPLQREVRGELLWVHMEVRGQGGGGWAGWVGWTEAMLNGLRAVHMVYF